MKENNAGVNTILLVLILVVIVAGIVWFVQGTPSQQAEDDEARIEVQLPGMDNEGTENNQ